MHSGSHPSDMFAGFDLRLQPILSWPLLPLESLLTLLKLHVHSILFAALEGEKQEALAHRASHKDFLCVVCTGTTGGNGATSCGKSCWHSDQSTMETTAPVVCSSTSTRLQEKMYLYPLLLYSQRRLLIPIRVGPQTYGSASPTSGSTKDCKEESLHIGSAKRSHLTGS